MKPAQFFKAAATAVILTGVYFGAGKLGLRLAFVNASATVVWAPTGIALAALLIFGYRVWPAILAGAFLVNLTTAGSLATSVAIAVGNTLEGIVGAYLVERLANGRNAFDRSADVFKFAALAAVVSPTLSATFGVTSLALAGFAQWPNYGSIWLRWWTGDASGGLIVAPLVILWSQGSRFKWARGRVFEAAAFLLCLVFLGLALFGGFFPSGTNDYPLDLLLAPLLIWAAFRFGQRETMTGIGVVSGMAIWGTLHGFGPFVRETPDVSLLLLQGFMGVVTVMSLAVAAIVSERRAVEERLRELAGSDPVTGLANYRRFMDNLAGEIERTRRSGRPFALLMQDLDSLKQINDRYGHLTGTRALCRLADVLRFHSRAVDTASRFGGDEFALIPVDTAKGAVQQVAQRISERLATDREDPPLSVSAGVAVYPQDGETPEKLIQTADRALYVMKSQGGGKLPSAR